MSSKYDQIMEHVRVTPQMRTRILKNASTLVDKNINSPSLPKLENICLWRPAWY